MTGISKSRRPAFGILAVMGGVLLASCQTSADEVLSLNETSPSEEAAATTNTKSFRDPYVVAVSGQVADASTALASQNETDEPRLKRKPVPMAAAYSDIAEPPPEVLALQQQANQGSTPSPAQAQPAADLGELTMQPTAVAPGNNSLFSAGQRATAPVAPTAAAPEIATAAPAPRSSLVPSDMPTLGVNAVRKSLFSPSAEQQMLMQQQALQEQARAASQSETLPLAESAAAGAEEPVLRKLSDPRPKRKILALRESTNSVPNEVQLTPDQLAAMGAVEEADPAEPLPAEELAAQTEAPQKKKGWLPSLSDLLKGGKKKQEVAAAP